MSLLHLIDDVLLSAGRRGECVVLAGIAVLLLCSSDVRRLIRAAPRRYVSFLCLYFAVICAAQVRTRGQYVYPQKGEPFPLTRFAMFADVPRSFMSRTSTYHFAGRTSDGGRIILNPLHLLPTIDFSTFHTRVRMMAAWLESDDAIQQDSATRVLTDFARVLAERHNADHPTTRVSQVDVVQKVIDLRRSSSEQPVEESVIVSFRMPDAAR